MTVAEGAKGHASGERVRFQAKRTGNLEGGSPDKLKASIKKEVAACAAANETTEPGHTTTLHKAIAILKRGTTRNSKTSSNNSVGSCDSHDKEQQQQQPHDNHNKTKCTMKPNKKEDTVKAATAVKSNNNNTSSYNSSPTKAAAAVNDKPKSSSSSAPTSPASFASPAAARRAYLEQQQHTPKDAKTKCSSKITASKDKNNENVLQEKIVLEQTEKKGNSVIHRQTIHTTKEVTQPEQTATDNNHTTTTTLDPNNNPFQPVPGRHAVHKQYVDTKATELKTDEKYTRDMPRHRLHLAKRDSTPTGRDPIHLETPGDHELGQAQLQIKETISTVDPTAAKVRTPSSRPAPDVDLTKNMPSKPAPTKPAPSTKPAPAVVVPKSDGGRGDGDGHEESTITYINQNLHRTDAASKTVPFKPGQTGNDDVLIVKKSPMVFQNGTNVPIDDPSEIKRVKPKEIITTKTSSSSSTLISPSKGTRTATAVAKVTTSAPAAPAIEVIASPAAATASSPTTTKQTATNTQRVRQKMSVRSSEPFKPK